MGGIRHPSVIERDAPAAPRRRVAGRGTLPLYTAASKIAPRGRPTRRKPPRSSWPAWPRRDAPFLLALALLLAATFGLLSLAGAALQRTAATARIAAPPARATGAPATAPTVPSPAATVRPAHERIWNLPNGNAGLMMPAVDAQGNVWVGEMSLNHLARVATISGAVTEWTPPNGQNTIMQTLVDHAGMVWFTEEGANYIGRFDPARAAFATYPLGDFGGHRMGPQDLKMDAAGKLWFVGTEAGRIGRLDPATGALQSWPVPPSNGKRPDPYALALTPDGQVWFADLAGGVVGRLDPASGAVSLVRLPDPTTLIFSMASGTRGHIWFTELSSGKLGRIDTATGKVTELAVPAVAGAPQGLYQVVAAPDGAVWFACAGANALVRYRPETGVYTFYTFNLPQSTPYGLTLDASGNLWFTADAASGNYVGRVTP